MEQPKYCSKCGRLLQNTCIEYNVYSGFPIMGLLCSSRAYELDRRHDAWKIERDEWVKY